jgi:molybdopterin synthase sulfur carrier subunit
VLRSAMAVDTLDPCGVYFGTTGGQVYACRPTAATLDGHRPRPAGGAVGRGADAAMIRRPDPTPPAHLAGVGKEVELQVAGPVTQRAVLDALEARYPMLRGTIRDRATQQRRPLIRFFACVAGFVPRTRPMRRCPPRSATGEEPLMIVGAMAGGNFCELCPDLFAQQRDAREHCQRQQPQQQRVFNE